ncbi:MAG: hypothetical protein EXR62_09445 [Chloroflexi bacterium]|nr:hypothetical protein [Chloroflexota bacterium]
MYGRDRGEQGPVAPKPFHYIPFAASCQRGQPAGHDVYRAGLLSGKIGGEIEVLTPLHIGAGGIELTEKLAPSLAKNTPLIKAFVKSGGRRVIPGSSLKGAVRSIVEAITPSCVAKTARSTQVPRGLGECQKPEQLCPACRIFGALGYLGQVQFSDGVQEDRAGQIVDLPSLYMPRGRGEARGRKFYHHGKPATGNTPVEAVPEHTRFAFSLRFENLRPEELGVLLIALGQGPAPALHPKLGGGKPACYGTVEFQQVQATLAGGAESWLDFDAASKVGVIADYVQSALDKPTFLLRPQLEALAEALKYPSGKDCPGGMY